MEPTGKIGGSFCNYHNDVNADIIVAWAVKSGILSSEKVPEDLLEEIKSIMAIYD